MAASALRYWLPTALRSLSPARKSRTRTNGVRIAFETLEARDVPNAAFDLIHLSGGGGARSDARFAGINGAGAGSVKQSVVIIDTGLDSSHPLLSGNFEYGYDFFGPGAGKLGATVSGDHGTHVSGTVGSTDPEIGVAPGVGLIGLNVFGPTADGLRAPNDDIEQALRWVIDNKTQYNIVAVNMSLGGGRFTSLDANAKNSQVADEITQLESQGVVVVTAAGNNYKRPNGNEVAELSSPAIVSTIAVGSVWQDGVNSGVQWGSGAIDNTTGPDRIVSHSNRLTVGTPGDADYVNTLFAPGAIINSTVPGGGIEGMAGTSMASPHIAGIVALVQDAATRFLGHQLGALQVRSILFDTADTVVDGDDEDTNVVATGVTYKRVNVERALDFVYSQSKQLPAPPPVVPPGQTPPPPPTTGIDPNGTIYGAVSVADLTPGTTVSVSGTIGFDYGTKSASDVAGDVDIFRFVIAPGQDFNPIRLAVAGTADAGGNFDTYLRVFDGAGTEVATNDDVDLGSGLVNSALTLTVPAGTYYAAVSAFPNYDYNPFLEGSGAPSPTGSYTLDFRSDAVDPNGTRFNAIPLAQDANGRFGSVSENVGTDKAVGYNQLPTPVAVAGDVDMYSVVAPDDGSFTFEVLGFRGGQGLANGLTDSYLRVWRNYVAVDASGVPVSPGTPPDYAFNDDIDLANNNRDSRIVQFPVHAGDIVHIGVSGFLNGSYNPDVLDGRSSKDYTGDYNLSATFNGADLNGTLTTAVDAKLLTQDPNLYIAQQGGNIGFDSFNNGAQKSTSTQDIDLVRFNFPATFNLDGTQATAAVFQFSLSAFGPNLQGVPGISNPVDGIITLFDADGNPLAQVDDTYDDKGNFLTLDPTLQYTVEAGQTYYVGISGYSNFGYDPRVGGSGSSGSDGSYFFNAELIGLDGVRDKTDNKAGKSNPSVTLGETIAGVIGSDAVAGAVRNATGTVAITTTFNDPDTQDVDFRQFTATGTGVMDVRVRAFEDFSAANGTIRVFTANADGSLGDAIPSTLVDIGPLSGGAVRFAATAGQTYYIGVTGSAYQAAGNFDGKSTIPLSAADKNNPAVILGDGGYNLTVNALATLDADGNGSVGSNDAILLSRYLTGLEPELLTDGLNFPAGATRTDGVAIAAYFDAARQLMFDANGDGAAGGSNDAILTSRYATGLEPELLTDGVTFGILAQRTGGAAIADYFSPLMPAGGGRVAPPAGRGRLAGPAVPAASPAAAGEATVVADAPAEQGSVAIWTTATEAAGTTGVAAGDGTAETTPDAGQPSVAPPLAAAAAEVTVTLADLPPDTEWVEGIFVG